MSLFRELRKSTRHDRIVNASRDDTTNIADLNADVLLLLTDTMDLRSLQKWRATCRTADRNAAYALNLRYNSVLGRFVSDPTGLRNILRVTRSVISGSAALHVLDSDRAGSWMPNDLDIYAPIDTAAQVVAYLVTIEGYTVADPPPHAKYSYEPPGFNSVAHLRCGDVDIDVIRSNTVSALHPIAFFWSTHLINYLSADCFCVAYPDDLLDGKGLLNPIHLVDLQYPTPRTIQAMMKYTSRGYDFRTRPTAWAADPAARCEGGPSCPRTIRYFGDKYCLMGSFRTHADPAFNSDRALPDASRTARWWRGGPTCGVTCFHAIRPQYRVEPRVQTVRTVDVV